MSSLSQFSSTARNDESSFLPDSCVVFRFRPTRVSLFYVFKMNKKRKLSPNRSTYQQKYKAEWEKELKWLKIGKTDTSATCVLCNTQLNVCMGGVKDLRRHETTELHKKNARAVDRNSLMSSFVIQQNNGVVDAELRFANFVTENNLPMKLADNFTKLVPAMFPDSVIAKNFKCCRTKTSQLIEQVLCRSVKDDIISKMQQSFFTLLIDESTDKATLRQMVIMARIFGEHKVETHLFQVVAFEGAATGENLYNVVDKAFEEDKIPWENCLSMSSDGARAMVGEFNSVLSRVKQQQGDVWFLHCTCHVAHLTASHATDQLPDVFEQFARDVYTFFKTSGKRQCDFRKIQASLELDTHKILRPCFTRWLAMLQCVDRLLEQWPALTLYFDETIDEKERKSEAVKRIQSTLHSDYAKLYFLFVQAVLPRFTKFNIMFQHESPIIHKLHKEMCSLLRQFVASFVQFSVIQRTDFVNIEIDYSKKNQLNDASLFIGHKTRTLLEEGNITCEEKKEFYQNIRTFFEKGTKEMYRLLPFGDAVLKNITVFDPLDKTGNWDKIEALVKRFPNVIVAEEMDTLNAEFMHYSLWEPPAVLNINQTDDIDVYWDKVSKSLEFPTLTKLAKTMLILPHSNAEVERVFSKLTLIKTCHRTSLGSPMLNALMHCSTRKHMGEFTPTDSMRRKARQLKK